jgi:predicted GTPase
VIVGIEINYTCTFNFYSNFPLYRLQDDDYKNNAAKVGVTETTRERKVYQYPDNPMIGLVDLPGIGTPNYPDLKTYCRKVELESYDTFLIFTATRFTVNDLELAKKVKSLGKSFFLIRSKIDVELMPKRGKAILDEEATLEEMRNDCIMNVRGMISSEDQVFLIGSYDKGKWDFDRLVKAIGKALPILQRESLILSLSNLTHGCLRRKTNYLKGW